MEPRRDFSLGDVIMLTSGEYDSYGPIGIYRALRDFSMPDEIDAFGKLKGSNIEKKFAEHLVLTGVLDPIAHDEAHVGAYDEIYKTMYCRHPESKRRWGRYTEFVMQSCSVCGTQFPATRKPADPVRAAHP